MPIQLLTSQLLGLLDQLFRIMNIVLGPARPKFFSQGYGDDLPAIYQRRAQILAGKHRKTLTSKDIEWETPKNSSDITTTIGSFVSPMADLMPAESLKANFLLVEPTVASTGSTDSRDVVVVMLPAKGEMGTGTRRKLARALALEKGWKTVIPTAPYYGRRRPSGQRLFFISSVRDILCQSLGMMQEAALLIEYFQKGPESPLVCVTGFSWGAAMSAGASVLVEDGSKLCVAAYVGSASPLCMADGVLTTSIDWQALRSHPAEPQFATQKRLWDELNKTQLTPPSNLTDERNTIRDTGRTTSIHNVAVVKAVSMRDDAFIRPRYAREFHEKMMTMLSSSTSVSWFTGGHVWAALQRPWYHKQLIVQSVEELQKKQ